MLMSNNLYLLKHGEIEGHFSSEGPPCSFPPEFYVPFCEGDISILEDGYIQIATSVVAGIKNISSIIKELEIRGERNGSGYTEFFRSMVSTLESYKDPKYTLYIGYGLFGDTMTKQNMYDIMMKDRHKLFSSL